ncbi:Na+/H+ antiporter subunit C [Hyalangium gracile]|uniref:Na+/H+ antiporter subunit C n=1 Tax=Hyalangium gracile TaxID=394092 RepID=UPI001CCEF618|nr:Na+/H+ antiporter subunit C [Hyalangium gracile]
MESLLALVIGGLYATGLYMILRRNIVKLVIGLALLAHATNLLVFTSVGLTRGRAPLVPEGAETTAPGVADPLAQALVLTAIVISFGLLVFMVVLLYRAHQSIRFSELDELRNTER